MSRRLAFGAVLLSVAAGCGYTFGYQPVAPGIRTIAIEVVDNISYRQRLERDLTREIGRHLSRLTGYRRAARDQADAILRVQIVAVRNSSLVLGRPIVEGSLDTVASIVLEERRSGKNLVDTRRRDIAEYRSMVGEDESSARRELVSDLGRQIVLALEGEY